MKKRRPLLALASLLVLAAASSPAQTASHLGSNTFDDANALSPGGVPLFQYSLGTSAGTLSVNGGRLEYTAAAADSSRVLRMNTGTNTAYTSDWTASLTLTNLAVPATGLTLISLQVFDATATSGFFNVGLLRSLSPSPSNNSYVLVEKARVSNGLFLLNSGVQSEPDATDVLVRLSHNAATKDLTFGYSLDNGVTYQFTYVFNPTSSADGGSWPTAPTDGYSFRILARNTAGTVETGQMFADNFSVTAGATAMVAVPEPSTYAAIAGAAALGLAFWHRRRQARRAS